MQKKVVVLSLGGSLIVPDEIDLDYLRKFRKIILKNKSKYKFIIATGGGGTARKYINALRALGANDKLQSYAGISATRINARFVSYLFNEEQKEGIPHKLKHVEKLAKKQNIVVCGALEYRVKQTTDATATEIAKHFKAIFINLTNVSGLYDKNPKEFKDAKFISEISWHDFNRLANKIKYKPGQHFVLDQTAAKIIMKHKIPAYILGKDVKQLDNLLNGRKFVGTKISG